MTTYPLTWLADELRAAGCRVVEESGWKSRGRPASSGSFTPRGLLRHWDASSKGSHGAISTVINGNGSTPGPLCSILTCRGNDSHGPSVHVIAAGRTNHGGEGDGWGNIPADQANTYAVGHEIAHTSNEAWGSDQMEQVRRAEAAIMKRLGANPAKSLPCHAEYAPGRKVDTNTGSHAQDMDKERSEVQAYMDGDDMPKDHYLTLESAEDLRVAEGASEPVRWLTEASDDEEWHHDGWASIEPNTPQIATVAGWITLDAPGRVYLTIYQEDGETRAGHVAMTDGGPGPVNIACVSLVKAHFQLRMLVGGVYGPVGFSGGKLRWHSFDH